MLCSEYLDAGDTMHHLFEQQRYRILELFASKSLKIYNGFTNKNIWIWPYTLTYKEIFSNVLKGTSSTFILVHKVMLSNLVDL